MKHGPAYAALLAAVAAGALAFRLVGLGDRPMHHDEANQAVRAGLLLEEGAYRYDPQQHHGPTLYYLSLPIAYLQGGRDLAATTEATFRIVPVLFGAGGILLLALLRSDLGRAETLAAAVALAVSPAAVYYSRFYIQESLLVFFTFMALAAAWRWLRSGRLGWALLAGAGLGLMHATKETCVLAWAAMALGALAAVPRIRAGALPRPRWTHAAAALAAGLAVSALFFSSFFTHARGPLDSVLAYGNYLSRAGGDGLHNQPCGFYLHRLCWWRYGRGPVWSEAFLLALGAVGAVFAFLRRNALLPRVLAVYTVALLAIYSLIPYKTPWCVLSFLQGAALLAGFGAVALFRRVTGAAGRIALVAALAAGTGHLAWQAHRAVFRYAADVRNPYVYAQTRPDLLRLARRVADLAAVHPDGRGMRIHVIAHPYDYWPLPWYLRACAAGYWPGPGEAPDPADAPVVITRASQEKNVRARLRNDYLVEYYGLRPGIPMAVFIRRDLWDAFMKRRGGAP
jgi:uncharacterized protein (TIGR03663 family)